MVVQAKLLGYQGIGAGLEICSPSISKSSKFSKNLFFILEIRSFEEFLNPANLKVWGNGRWKAARN